MYFFYIVDNETEPEEIICITHQSGEIFLTSIGIRNSPEEDSHMSIESSQYHSAGKHDRGPLFFT